MDESTHHNESWCLEFYVDHKGRSPVAEFLQDVPTPERDKIRRYLGYLERSGPALGMPHARHIRGRLWELRPDSHRVLYAQTSRRFVVLSAFRKTSRKTPRGTISHALRRLDDLLARE